MEISLWVLEGILLYWYTFRLLGSPLGPLLILACLSVNFNFPLLFDQSCIWQRLYYLLCCLPHRHMLMESGILVLLVMELYRLCSFFLEPLL